MGGYGMTREEEILKQTNIYTSDSLNYTAWCDEHREYDDIEFIEQAFISGAKWADKTIIEKACKWLEQHKDDYFDYEPWKDVYVDFNALITDFKKKMEE